jgi:hypothetical protein
MTNNHTPLLIRRASEIFYDEITSSRNSLRRENARLIKEVCDQMEQDKVPISIAEVVRRCGTGGPAYSTVSNQGSNLGEFVRLRISEQAANPSAKARVQSIADTISDPVAQARVRDTESTARWLARENNGLRALFKSLRPGLDIDALIKKTSDPAFDTLSLATPPDTGLTKINAVELQGLMIKLMDHLVGTRQYKETRGRLTINGKIVLDARDLKVYCVATGLSEQAWQTRYGEPPSKLNR